MDTKPNPPRNLKIVKMEQNYIKINIYIYYILYIHIPAEEFRAILKSKTKTSCMSKNSSKVSDEKNRKCYFGPNLPKNGFYARTFENLTPDLELAFPIYHA